MDNGFNLDFVQCLLSDERRLQQTILNLLSNSMKFSNQDGQIKILVKILNKQQEKNNRDFSDLTKKVEYHVKRKKTPEEIDAMLKEDAFNSVA
jgi:signal transduction histidine kinase